PALAFHSFEPKAQAFVKCDCRFVRGINIQFYPLQADSLCARDRFFGEAPPDPLTTIIGQHTHAKASNVRNGFPFMWKNVTPADHLLAVESNKLGNAAGEGGPDEFTDRVHWRRLRQRQV